MSMDANNVEIKNISGDIHIDGLLKRLKRLFFIGRNHPILIQLLLNGNTKRIKYINDDIENKTDIEAPHINNNLETLYYHHGHTAFVKILNNSTNKFIALKKLSIFCNDKNKKQLLIQIYIYH